MSKQDSLSDQDDVMICYQMIPLIEDDPDREIPAGNLTTAPENASGPFELAIGKDVAWNNGQTIKIAWWNGPGQTGTDNLKRKVRKVAKEWDAICNINLNFGDHGENSDVRVAFMPGQGSWSYVGTQCKSVAKSEATMNFGWLDDNSSDERIRSVVLHEFGHLLGAVHEHQNPAAGIKWNERAVLDYFSKPPNSWDADKIQRNILNPVATSMNSVFDPDSIMLYFFPASLTIDNKGTHANNNLSAMDRTFIRKLYPPQARAIGVFDTDDRPNFTDPTSGNDTVASPPPLLLNTLKVNFDPPYEQPPKVAIGLSRLDLACKANKAVAASVGSIDADSAEVSVNTWDTSVLNGGAASWVEAKADDTEWQFGEFNTQELRNRNDKSSRTAEKVVYFNDAYDEPPAIVVALKLIDLENYKDYRVKAYATDIQKDRFTIHIDTWGDSILYAAAASWIAYPADLASSISGTFVSKENQSKSSGRFEFPQGKFGKKPTVRVFLNLIDVKCGTDLRAKVSYDQVTESGVDWHADTWSDTRSRQIGGSLLAWA